MPKQNPRKGRKWIAIVTLIGGVMLAACRTATPAADIPTPPPATLIPPTPTMTPVPPTPPPNATAAPLTATIPPTGTPVPPTGTPAPTTTLPIPALALRQIAAGFGEPVYLAAVPDGSGRLWVLERRGVIRLVGNGEPALTVLDISARVGAGGQEQGLLGMAFHPNFAANGRAFLNYTNRDGDTVVAEFRATADGSALDAGSERILLTISQPYQNHNGGQLQFGPDGNLYIGMGDGGLANDPHENGQNVASLLGKLLRISVDFGDPYTVPADNPFLDTPNARPEIWAIGLRNPWRFSFDRETGDLWIADVGQNKFEEIDFLPFAESGGANFGWDVLEGLHCFTDDKCDPTGTVLPVVEYSHDDGCSVTGG